MNYKKLIINTDGGARGNPGPAGIGAILADQDGNIIEKYKEYIGRTTNNQAEYQAVVKGLEMARDLLAKETKPRPNGHKSFGVWVEVRLDSELVCKQINGEYKLKNPEFQQWFIKIHNLRQQFKKISFKHVPREQNMSADQLVNQVLDEFN